MPPPHWNAAEQELDGHLSEMLRRHALHRTRVGGEDRHLVVDDVSDQRRVCPLQPGVIIKRDGVGSALGRDPPCGMGKRNPPVLIRIVAMPNARKHFRAVPIINSRKPGNDSFTAKGCGFDHFERRRHIEGFPQPFFRAADTRKQHHRPAGQSAVDGPRSGRPSHVGQAGQHTPRRIRDPGSMPMQPPRVPATMLHRRWTSLHHQPVLLLAGPWAAPAWCSAVDKVRSSSRAPFFFENQAGPCAVIFVLALAFDATLNPVFARNLQMYLEGP